MNYELDRCFKLKMNNETMMTYFRVKLFTCPFSLNAW
jgi:hypothetical protein